MKRLVALCCKANELEAQLEASIAAIQAKRLAEPTLEQAIAGGGKLREPDELPTPRELSAVTAQLARLIREGRPQPANDSEEEP
jgi:hypothetical protein